MQQLRGFRRAGAIALSVLLILAWTAVVRLPFWRAMDGDEFYLAVIAAQWLDGRLPYVASFDIKPPGLYFIFALAQGLFGTSYATIKGLEIVAVAAGALALFGMLRTEASSRAAVWAAVLYPVFTLALSGFTAVAMLVQLPFFILTFWAVVSATREGTSRRDAMVAALLAGLAVGMAGMIKQTAVFEAIAALSCLAIYAPRGQRLALVGAFVVGGALPALGFAAWFAAAGAFAEMFNAVVVLALRRSNEAVAASYGPELQWYLTTPGALVNAITTSGPLVFLWGAALFVALRYRRISETFPPRLIVMAGVWLAAAFAGVVVGKVLVTYYVLALVPPLLILGSALFCHGLDVRPGRQGLAFALSFMVAAFSVLYIGRSALLVPTVIEWGDYDASQQAADAIRALNPGPDDRLLVVSRGVDIYIRSGLRPPSPYFHGTHLLAPFNTPSADPLGETLAATARFVVVANPALRRNTEMPERLRRVAAYLAAHYRVAATVDGTRDSFTIYELAR